MLISSPTSLTYPNPISTNPATSYSAFSNPLTMASFYYPENPVLTVVNRIEDGSFKSGWGKGEACSGLMAAIDRFFGWGTCSQQITEDTSYSQKRHIYQVTNFTYEMTNSTRCDIFEKPPLGNNYNYAVEIAAVKSYKNFSSLIGLPKNCSFYSSSLSIFHDAQEASPYTYTWESRRCQSLSACIQNYIDRVDWKNYIFLECETSPNLQKINQTHVQYKINTIHGPYLLNISNDQLTDWKPTNIDINRTEVIKNLFLDRIQMCVTQDEYEYSLRNEIFENANLRSEQGKNKIIGFGVGVATGIIGTIIISSTCLYFYYKAKKPQKKTYTIVTAMELKPNEVVVTTDEESSSRV